MPPSNPDAGEVHREYRVRYKDPASGVDLAHDVTTDPRRAGQDYREHRAILAGGPGEIALEERTVTRSPWRAVESESLGGRPT